MKEEIKQKISKSKIGVSVKHCGQFKSGITSWNKGKRTSSETKEKQRQAKLKNPVRYWLGRNRKDLDLSNRISPKGKNHWNWKNGINPKNDTIRKSKEYKLWRELVFERDNWTCQKCLNRGGDIHCHHIQNFSNNDSIRFDIDNGITLCRKCHYNFHKEYGFNNNNREQLKFYL